MYAFDTDEVLTRYKAKVEWADTLVDGEGNKSPMPEKDRGWVLVDPGGVMNMNPIKEFADAQLAGALFLHLWGDKKVDIALAHRCAVSHVMNYTVRDADHEERERLARALRKYTGEEDV